MARTRKVENVDSKPVLSNKDKANELKKRINGQFKKDLVYVSNEPVFTDLERLSSGILPLDLILGGNSKNGFGFPFGRSVEVFGAEHSGKCLTKDTLINTESGLEKIEEIFNRFGHSASCTTKVTEVDGLRLYNEFGKLEKATHITHNGKRKVFEIENEHGMKIKATENHPLRVINRNGDIVWKKVGDISTGDYLVCSVYETDTIDDKITEEEALLLGYLVGDGCITQRNVTGFTQVDNQTANEYKELVKKVVGKDVKTSGIEHKFFDVSFHDSLLEKYGLSPSNSHFKEIPYSVRTSSNNIKAKFLSAYFECDGYVDKRTNTIGITSASEQLIKQTQIVLQGMGIESTVFKKYNKKYQRFYFCLYIGSDYKNIFYEKIGFRSDRRNNKINYLENPTNGYYDIVPNFKEIIESLSKSNIMNRKYLKVVRDCRSEKSNVNKRILKYVSNYYKENNLINDFNKNLIDKIDSIINSKIYFSKVISNNYAGIEPTFDFSMEHSHSFIANGILSHNTLIVMNTIAQAQKQGYLCAFVDNEATFDADFAEKCGVNIEELLVVCPDDATEAFETIESLVNSGEIRVVALDSIGSLVLRTEAEDEIDKDRMGGIAKALGKFMRRIVPLLRNNNCLLLAINQVRESINATGRPGTYTPGGRSPRHAHSIRLEIKKEFETLKNDKKEDIGVIIRAHTKKNKTFKPFQTAEFQFDFETGVVLEGALIETAIMKKVLGGVGTAWLSFEDKKWNGKNALLAELKTNKELYERLYNKVLENMNND